MFSPVSELWTLEDLGKPLDSIGVPIESGVYLALSRKTENPRVGGSIPPPGTIRNNDLASSQLRLFGCACNSCVIRSSFFVVTGVRCRVACRLHDPQGDPLPPHARSALVGIARHHRQSLVTRNSLNSRQIETGLCKVRYHSVPQCVWRDLIRIKTCPFGRLAKCFSNCVDVPCCTAWGRKHPFASRWQHTHPSLQVLSQFTSHRLFPRSCLDLRNPNNVPP